MRILAWDTSSHSGAVCAMNDGQVIAEFSLGVEAFHSERLLWAIHQVLEACRWKLEDVDAFSVGMGPGSFTGLRIGITTARTLAHTLGKPLYSFSSLSAMARPYCEWVSSVFGKKKVTVLAQTDAAKGEWFYLMGEAKEILLCRNFEGFGKMGDRSNASGLWRKSVIESVSDPEFCLAEFYKKVKKDKSHWMVLGSDFSSEQLKPLPKAKRVQLPKDSIFRVQPRYAGVLSYEAVMQGAKSNPLEVHPRYLRVADAEKKLQQGLLKKNAPTRGIPA